MNPDDFKLIVATFLTVFPHTSLWLLANTPDAASHAHLIGSDGPVVIDYARVSALLQRQEVTADIGRMEFQKFTGAAEFASQMVLDEAALRRFVGGEKRLNTDDLPYAEFFRRPGRNTAVTKWEQQRNLLRDIYAQRTDPTRSMAALPADSAACGAFVQNLRGIVLGDSVRALGHREYLESLFCREDEVKTHTRGYMKFYNEASQFLPDEAFLQNWAVR